MVDEQRVIERARSGDTRAFEAILREYEGPVFNAAYRVVGNHEDAADITQTVFIKAYEKLSSYDPRYRFFSWIYRIAVNEAISFARKRRREVPVEQDLLAGKGVAVDHLARIGRDELIQSALRRLTTDHRVVIVLKYFLELSYKEISEIIELPEKTVKSRLFEGREQLRRALILEGHDG
jgi:RNA polymerase sigma-70 factor (ECF subfamily)